MKKMIFIWMFCVAGLQAFSQENNLSFVGEKTNAGIRKWKMDSTADVAKWVLSGFTSETDKVRSIYSWVTRNIRYDKTGTFALNAGTDKGAKIHVAFLKRKGVCENFAAIFNDICKKAGLESFVIEGYTRMNGFLQNGAHSWVTVRIGNEWYFFDPTWDEGGRLDYFMVTPQEFISTHIPFDPLWQFLTEPAGYNRGSKKKMSDTKDAGTFNYKDSLAAYLEMDSLQKWESSERRILKAGMDNKHAETNLKLVKMNLEIERQGEQVIWYNEAIDNLNQSVEILNQFIAFRNNFFLPRKTEQQLAALLREPETKIRNALALLTKTDESKASLVMGTWQVRERITSFEKKLETQKAFLEKYLQTPEEEREKLFYK